METVLAAQGKNRRLLAAAALFGHGSRPVGGKVHRQVGAFSQTGRVQLKIHRKQRRIGSSGCQQDGVGQSQPRKSRVGRCRCLATTISRLSRTMACSRRNRREPSGSPCCPSRFEVSVRVLLHTPGCLAPAARAARHNPPPSRTPAGDVWQSAPGRRCPPQTAGASE